MPHPHRDLPDRHIDAAAQRLLTYGDRAGPLAPLHDVAAQRLVAAAMAARREAGPASMAPPASGHPRRWLVAGVLAGAAAVAAVTLGLWLLRNAAPTSGADSAPPLTSPAARLVLRTGPVTIDGQDARVEARIAEGREVHVPQGLVALALPGGEGALLEPGCRLRLARLGGGADPARGTTLALEQGALVMALPPRPGRPPFAVQTPAGQVVVTGTAFRVAVVDACEGERDCVSVGVLRGQVRLEEPGQDARTLGPGHVTYLRRGPGARIVWALDPGARRHLAQAVGRLRELTAAGPTAEPRLLAAPAAPRLPLARRDPAGVGTKVAAEPPPGRSLRATPHGARARRAPEAALRSLPRGSTPESAARPSPGTDGGDDGPGPAAPGGDRGPAPAMPDARTLMQRASQQRAAMDWSGAARHYAALIALHPTTPQALAARVSLGLLLLDHLSDPRGALRHFDDYLRLAPSGTLAEEAAWGRIRALRRLGLPSAEERALRAFLARHPASLLAPRARLRLRALSAP